MKKLFLIFCGLFINSQFVMATPVSEDSKIVAKGGKGGGGGSHVIVNGERQISDLYYKALGEMFNYSAFPEDLQKYIYQVFLLLNRYGIENPKLWNAVGGPNIVYIMVTKTEFQSVGCPKYLPPLTITPQYHGQFDCAVGNTSYLVKEEFEAPGISLKTQALSVIHSRLWGLNPNVDQRFIASFIKILNNLLERSAKQLKGDRTPLSEKDLSEFDELALAARQLQFTVSLDKRNIVVSGGGILSGRDYYDNRGGGLVPCETPDKTGSFVGIGSEIERCSQITNSTVLVSSISHSTVVGSTIEDSIIERSKVQTSTLYNSKVQDAAVISSVFSDSSFSGSDRGARNVRSHYAEVTNSKLKYIDLLGSADATVVSENSDIYGSWNYHQDSFSAVHEGVQLINFKTHALGRYDFRIDLEISRFARIENVEWTAVDGAMISVGAHTSLQNLNLTHSNNPFARRNHIEFGRNLKLDFNKMSCEVRNEGRFTVNSLTDLTKYCD